MKPGYLPALSVAITGSAYFPTASILILLALAAFRIVQIAYEQRISLLTIFIAALLVLKLCSFLMAVGSEFSLVVFNFGDELRYFFCFLCLFLASHRSVYAYSKNSPLLQLPYIYAAGVLLWILEGAAAGEQSTTHHYRGAIAVGAMATSHLAVHISGRPYKSMLLFLFCFLIGCVGVVLSGSRMALVGGSVLLLLVATASLSRVARGCLLSLFLAAAVAVANFAHLPPSFQVAGRVIDFEALGGVISSFEQGMRYGEQISEPAELAQSGYIRGEVDYNLQARFFLYGKATRRFLEYPVLGSGVGTFDDHFLCVPTWGGLCEEINVVNPKGSTAHSAYFHVLAEEGIMGFLITFSFFLYLYKSCCRRVSQSGHLVIVFGVISIFSHALGSPLYIVTLVCPAVMIASTAPLEKNWRSARPSSHRTNGR